MRVIRATFLAGVIALAACSDASSERTCASNDGCLQDGHGGQCLPSPKSGSRWCAFPDPTCSQSLRWGVLTGDSLADQCVTAAPIDAGGVPDARPPASDAGAKSLTAEPPSLGFGTVTSGSSSTFGVTVGNPGASPTGNLSTTIEGADAASFSVSSNACVSLASQARCAVAITFAPTVTGEQSATLHVSDGHVEVSVMVLGTAVPAGTLVLMPARPTFASVALGASSMATVTVMNTGGAAVPGVSASVSGTQAADFTIGPDSCTGHDLVAAASCSLTVTYHPAIAGASSASLLVGSAGGSVSTSLTGTATVHLMVAVTGTGSGSVASTSPGGITCPATCAADLAATSVVLTATPSSDSIFAGWSACTGTARCTVTLAAAKTVTATFTLSHYCVDGAAGDDAHAGTSAAPLKTITKALTKVPPGGMVEVKPGTYSVASNGETFPIIVPTNASLVGDEANKGNGATPVLLDGEGLLVGNPGASHTTVVIRSNSTIAGFRVRTVPQEHVALSSVYVDRGSTATTIRNNTLSEAMHGAGLGVYSSSNVKVIGNIMNNNGTGMSTADSSGMAQGNVITGNTYGIEYSGTSAGWDFGGGDFASEGQNVFSCNQVNDIFDASIEGTIFARANQWDHAPPTMATECFITGMGSDYCGPAVLDAVGATLVSGVCP